MEASDTAAWMISADDLRELMHAIFTTADVPAQDAELVVDALLDATLSGYDAHGVMRVPRYVDELQRGVSLAQGRLTILKESAASAYVDAGHALGPVTATRAIDLACEKAAGAGVGCVTTKNSNDIGRLGSYLRRPAQRGYLALLLVNDSGGFPVVAPFGGASRFYSTNPIGAGIPRGDAEPLVIDMSTAVTSVGRLRVAAQRGEMVPEGWLIDQDGTAVVDPARFFAEPEHVALLPLGGMLAGHKGFALQLLVDVLAGALGGAGVSTGEDPGREANALFALAIDPDHFVSRTRFTELVNQMVEGLAKVQPLPGVEAVRVPGERAAHERRRRLAHGIPLSTTTRDALVTVLRDLGLLDKFDALLHG